METKDYLAQESYPLSTQSLDFIQNQILFIQKIGALLGVGAWLIQDSTETKTGLVFLNDEEGSFCELIPLKEGVHQGLRYYWVEEQEINGIKKQFINGSDTTDEGENTTYSFDKLKKPEDLWDADISEYEVRGLIYRRNNKTKLVTINGYVSCAPTSHSGQPQLIIPNLCKPKEDVIASGSILDNEAIDHINLTIGSDGFIHYSTPLDAYINVSYYAN